MKGIDVSNNQGVVDWTKVAGSGATFAWCKVSEGTWFHDSYWAGNYREAKKHGIHVGGYHYARPDRAQPVDEADYFSRLVGKPKPGDLIPMLDLEVKSSLSPAATSRWANTFMQRVEQNLGVPCGIYTYPYYLKGQMSQAVLRRGTILWYADYTGVGGKYRYLSWVHGLKVKAQQYSASGAQPGVRGRCDMDYAAALKAITVPAPAKPHPDSRWTWIRWWLGEGEYRKYGPRKGPHPGFWPGPKDWAFLVAFLARRKK